MASPLAMLGDYAGRTVDLLAIQDRDYQGNQPVDLSLFVAGESRLTAGLQKLVQRFLLELLTELGSLAYLPRRGCLFLLTGRLGGWRTAADVEQSFYESLLDIRRNLIAEESLDDPLDERFLGADLIASSLDGDRVVLRIEVSSRAERAEFLFPLAVNIMD